MKQHDPIRFAVVGARRGKAFIQSAQPLGGSVELVAVCDTNPTALEPWREQGVRLYDSYEQVLNDSLVDAVCLATPWPLHARQAIQALAAEKHVLSEVIAARTLEECWELVAAVNKSKRTYMMAENYCFSEAILQVQRMVEEGVFGELIHASGSYIHAIPNLLFDEQGELTWRGRLRRELRANAYPTHSLGPVARWLGINRTDKFKTTATWHSKGRAIPHYAGQKFPDRFDYAKPDFWMHADTVSTCIRTENGALIDLRIDSVSPRPHNMRRYELQGTKAAFSLPDGFAPSVGVHQPEPLIWIEGRSKTSEKGVPKEWEPLFKYRKEFEHPLWREHRGKAVKSGHAGGDYFTLREFISAIHEERPPIIDVYDAVTWSSITPLSEISIAQGNVPVEVPDFTQEPSP